MGSLVARVIDKVSNIHAYLTSRLERVSLVLLIYQLNEMDNGKVGRKREGMNMVAVLGMVQQGNWRT